MATSRARRRRIALNSLAIEGEHVARVAIAKSGGIEAKQPSIQPFAGDVCLTATSYRRRRDDSSLLAKPDECAQSLELRGEHASPKRRQPIVASSFVVAGGSGAG